MRYKFGKNWKKFIAANYDEGRLEIAKECLLKPLELPSLEGKSFLDIGSGSGLHSLAAIKAGAKFVISMDYDVDSVKTTYELFKKAGSPRNWKILQGDVLNRQLMERFHDIDIVYSWGVLHHTGNMYEAIRNAAIPCQESPNGAVFFLALYSHTTYESFLAPTPEEWLEIKQEYNKANSIKKYIMERQYIRRMFFNDVKNLKDLAAAYGRYSQAKREYRKARGMDLGCDVRDWLGGWPMEFVKEKECIEFCQNELGLKFVDMYTGEGNSEFLFASANPPEWLEPRLEKRKVVPLPGPFVVNDHMAFKVDIPQYSHLADAADAPRRSPVYLCEDGTPLSGPHSIYENILNFGAGRYRHWGGCIYFTTSDNSDPNTNGRTYSLLVDEE